MGKYFSNYAFESLYLPGLILNFAWNVLFRIFGNRSVWNTVQI